MQCDICGKPFQPDDEGVAMPFCSTRCKSIDRNRWMNEEYSLPYDDEDKPDEYFDPGSYDTNGNGSPPR